MAGPDLSGGAPGFRETVELLGGRARICCRSNTSGVVATFPNGYVVRAGFRSEDRAGARTDVEVWEDAEIDLLGGREVWYAPDGLLAMNPVGRGFSSLGEFAVRAAASGAFLENPRKP